MEALYEPSHNTDLHTEERPGSAAHDLPHCEEMVIQNKVNMKHSAVHDALNSDSIATSADHETRCRYEDTGGLFPLPASKRLRCTALQIDHESSFVQGAPPRVQINSSNDGIKLQLRTAGDEQNGSDLLMHARKHDEAVPVSVNEDQNGAVISQAGSDQVTDESEENSECATPKAGAQRIPDPKDLVCPPPPMKKKPTAFKRTISAKPSAFTNIRTTFLTSPPDLDTYPECIRALFDK